MFDADIVKNSIKMSVLVCSTCKSIKNISFIRLQLFIKNSNNSLNVLCMPDLKNYYLILQNYKNSNLS